MSLIIDSLAILSSMSVCVSDSPFEHWFQEYIEVLHRQNLLRVKYEYPFVKNLYISSIGPNDLELQTPATPHPRTCEISNFFS